MVSLLLQNLKFILYFHSSFLFLAELVFELHEVLGIVLVSVGVKRTILVFTDAFRLANSKESLEFFNLMGSHTCNLLH